jgi:FlaA1/EpsC-like NDP-sugar epimerase
LRNPKAAIAFAHDAMVAAVSVGAALYLRLGDSLFALASDVIATMVAAFVAVAAITFSLFGMYRGIWRYASIDDLLNITKAVTVAIVIFLLLMFMLHRLDEIPRSVPLIQWCLLIVALGGSRFAYRLLRHYPTLRRRVAGGAVPVLLLGAGNAAEQFIRASRGDPHAPYWVVGMLEDAGELQGRQIHGTAVLGRLADLPAVMTRLAGQGIHPQRLILSDPVLMDDASKQRVLEQAGDLGLRVARLPRLTELQDAGEEREIRPHPVSLEDLLGRPQFAHDHATLDRLIGGGGC